MGKMLCGTGRVTSIFEGQDERDERDSSGSSRVRGWGEGPGLSDDMARMMTDSSV